MRVGVDLGGTKIEIVALAGDGSEVIRRRVPTPTGDYAATLDVLCTLVGSVEGELGESGVVGIGTPGAVEPTTGLLRNSNSAVLNGKPIKRDIEARLGREIRVANDANCFALSEAVDGAGAGYQCGAGASRRSCRGRGSRMILRPQPAVQWHRAKS